MAQDCRNKIVDTSQDLLLVTGNKPSEPLPLPQEQGTGLS